MKEIGYDRLPWDKVRTARDKKRFTSSDIIRGISSEFIEVHGDRCLGDDKSIITGLAFINHQPFTIVAQDKGRTSAERIKKNYGMAYPQGYRKALRVMKEAEHFNRPILCLIDTPGAYPGIEAEEQGQSLVISTCLYEMTMIKSPIISIVIGEGGSGGALALSIADKIWMLENAIYSVISPEGCASILWRDISRAEEAAAYLKLTAQDLFDFKIIDGLIEESENFEVIYENIKKALCESMEELTKQTVKERLEKRNLRFRNIGTGTT